jgi:hypothetical protein
MIAGNANDHYIYDNMMLPPLATKETSEPHKASETTEENNVTNTENNTISTLVDNFRMVRLIK